MAFVGILSQIKLLFGPLVIQLVWYILKQLFTSVSVKVVYIYLCASRLGKYPPLVTSTSVINCWLFFITSKLMIFITPSFQQEKMLFRKMLYTNAARVAQSGSDVWTDSFITLLFPRESTFDLFSKSDPNHTRPLIFLSYWDGNTLTGIQLFQKRLLLWSVMRDAWSMFHSPQCTMVDSHCEREFQVENK